MDGLTSVSSDRSKVNIILTLPCLQAVRMRIITIFKEANTTCKYFKPNKFRNIQSCIAKRAFKLAPSIPPNYDLPYLKVKYFSINVRGCILKEL